MAAKGNNVGLMVVSGILLLGGVGAAVYFGRKANAAEPGTGSTGTGGNTGTGSNTGGGNTGGGGSSSSSQLSYNLVLKNGSRGGEVRELQLMLNNREPNSPLVVDGIFGPLTEAKLKRLNGGFGSITLAQAKLKWLF